MRTIISEKRLRAILTQKLLKENKGSGQSGMIKFTGGRTIAGLRYKNGRIEITDGRLATQMLTMLSRADSGMMGNIFEDIAEGSTIPSIISSGASGNQDNYINLNDTLNMANSPAADVGDTTFATSSSTAMSGSSKVYTIDGMCWSVKSTAARKKSGFTTLTTAVGQLGAIAYDEAASLNVITDRNSQPQAYQFLVDKLSVGDKIQYKMGLCYYKYDRQSSNVTLEQPVDNAGNPFYVFTITTPVTNVYANILPASVGKAVCKSYYTGDTDTSSLFKLPFAEKLVDSDRQIRLKQRIAKVGSQSPSEKMDCCAVATATPTCSHYEGSLVRWDPSQNKYVPKTQTLFTKVTTARRGAKSNATSISRHTFKFGPRRGNLVVGVLNRRTKKYMYSDGDADDIINDLTSQYKYNRNTYTQVMGLQNNIGSPEAGGETIDPNYSMSPAGRNLPVTSDETTLAAALYRGNVDRIKAFRTEIAHRIGLKAAGILSENLLAADVTLKNEIQSKYTGADLLAGVPLTIDDITDIVITAKPPDVFMRELIDDLPEEFLGLDATQTNNLEVVLKNMVNANRDTLKKVLKAYITHCRSNGTPDYLSIKSLQMPVINVDDRSNSTFKTFYCKPEDNTFTIERLPDTATIPKDKNPSQPIYNFSISSPTKSSIVSLVNSKVKVTSGDAGLVSDATGWKTSPSLIPSEDIHLTPNAVMAATSITTIVQEQDSVIKNAIAAQKTALSQVTSNLIIPMNSGDTLPQKLGRQAGGGIASSPSAQSATSLVDFSSNVPVIATRYRIGGDLFSLGEAKEILDAVSRTVESISVSSTNLSYPTSGNVMELSDYLAKKTPKYREVIQTVMRDQGARFVALAPLTGNAAYDIRVKHDQSVKYFLDSIRRLKKLYAPAPGITISSTDKQIIRSRIAAAIRDTQILENKRAVAWLNNHGSPDFVGGSFIYENTSQSGDETDITDVYYVGLSLLISSYAYTLSCLLPDDDLNSDIMGHLEDIGSDLNSLASQLDVMNPPVDLTGMDKGTDKYLNRVATLQSSLPTNQPLKSAAESRLYNNILKDIMEVTKKKITTKPKKTYISEKLLEKKLSKKRKSVKRK
jgi:hypothetical protein